MRKTLLTLAALAAFGIALPVASTAPASAETVIIKKDRGHHYGWRHHHARKVVVIKKRHRHHHHDRTVGASVTVR